MAEVDTTAKRAAEVQQMRDAQHAAFAMQRAQAFEKEAASRAKVFPMANPSMLMKQAPDVVFNTEDYAHTPETGFIRVADQPLSTFSADVDTASYANVRRFLNEGRLPPPDAVRIEELLNYFPYTYVHPTGLTPFAATLEVASAPWAPEHRLVRIGLKGREISTAARPAANLVFLLDVSGSMNAANKLPLVKQAMRLLVDRLRPDDRVAIVTYAGNAGLALPSTPARKASEILAAVDALQPSGSTNGAMGIQLAYDIAKANLVNDGINRVILCTDGDFNVGVSDDGSLTRLIEEKAKSGVFLSVLGFGMGNYQDAKLEALADKGNGNYGYIDSKREAEKLLVEQVNGTLVTIAKDVKLQVEFNPATVESYRLIGYENRRLQKEDFANDQVDAGEIGAGHTVTALYEIVPAKGGILTPADDLKYQKVAIDLTGSRELLTVKLRYKAPEGDTSQLLEFPLADDDATFATASTDFKFAASVAGFGMLLRDSEFKGASSWSEVQAWAEAGKGSDAGGYRDEFIRLIGRAEQLTQ
ncbi:MAG: VWA domain-containing protein [Opitutaceae bacterium]|nr:VWA domain-containing protein [Opitutaceae bacterium]